MTTARSRAAILAARIRMPFVTVAVLLLVAGPWFDVPFPVALAVFALAMLVYFRLGTVRGEPVTVRPPVRGRWRAVNSPTDHVPSHGLLAYGQSHAVDLIHQPEGTEQVRYGGWSLRGRPPESFPGFGQPVRSPVHGVVVRAVDRCRDHPARTTWPQVLALLVGSAVRELGGTTGLMGNHLVVRGRAGEYVALAHLRRGSVLVRRGDVVLAGQVVAECGNSGNSSEPHVHVQVMDHPRPWFAAGLPMAFAAPTAPGGVPSAHDEPVTWPDDGE